MPALYRKYRPVKLDDVIGQSQVTDALKNSLASKKPGHAYLFIGPRGCGKTSVARIFAHEINGFPYEIEDSYVDIIEIDAASNTGIDNIRELKERALIAPTEGKYKVYIIDEIHMLSKSAFNALLKILEEPPRHVIFIMATTDAFKVPATIISRSQVFTFKLSDEETMLSHLKKLAKSEEIKIEDSALEVIVHRGGGSFRDTISLLDQISSLSNGKTEITKEAVLESLGMPKDESLKELLTAYENADLDKISTGLKTLLESGVSAEIIASEIIEFIIKQPKPTYLELLQTLPEVSAPFADAKLLLSLSKKTIIPASTPNNPTFISRKAPEGQKTAEESAEPTSGFDWPTYLEKIQTSNFSLYDTLNKSEYDLDGSTLRINPKKRIYYNILKSARNLAVLKKHLPGNLTLDLLDPNELPKNFRGRTEKKDPTLSKISDIMGGNIKEVISDGGEPF